MSLRARSSARSWLAFTCLVAAACGAGSSGGVSGSTSAGGASSSSGSSSSSASTSASATSTASSASSSSSSGAGGASPHRWVMGYYAAWEAADLPVAEIPWNDLSHLAIAFYLPTTTGDVDTSLGLDPAAGKQLAHDLVAAAHAAGKKIVASIGGAGEHDRFASAASSAHRAAFVARLVKLVADEGFDGLDLDWEPVQAKDGANVVALAKDLRAALPNATLSMPISPENHNQPDDLSWVAALAAEVDQVNLMTYGMAGTYPGWKSWHSSALHWNHDTSTPTAVDDSVAAFLAAKVPPAKLGVGSGFYGLCYTKPVQGPDQDLGGAQIVANDGVMSYRHILTSYFANNVSNRDKMAGVPYLAFAKPHGAEGCTYVTYEDADSIKEKGAWAAAQGLGGLIIWTINQGHVPNAPAAMRDPLLDAAAAAFAP